MQSFSDAPITDVSTEASDSLSDMSDMPVTTTNRPSRQPNDGDNNNNIIISFSTLKESDRKPRKVFVKDLGGHVWVKPISSQDLDNISKISVFDENENELVRLSRTLQSFAEYLAEAACADEKGTPIATVEDWKSLTPNGLSRVFNLLSKDTATKGDEKNE